MNSRQNKNSGEIGNVQDAYINSNDNKEILSLSEMWCLYTKCTDVAMVAQDGHRMLGQHTLLDL